MCIHGLQNEENLSSCRSRQKEHTDKVTDQYPEELPLSSVRWEAEPHSEQETAGQLRWMGRQYTGSAAGILSHEGSLSSCALVWVTGDHHWGSGERWHPFINLVCPINSCLSFSNKILIQICWYVCVLSVCMYVYHRCLLLTDTRRGVGFPSNWSYRWLWEAMWLTMKSRSSAKTSFGGCLVV